MSDYTKKHLRFKNIKNKIKNTIEKLLRFENEIDQRKNIKKIIK